MYSDSGIPGVYFVGVFLGATGLFIGLLTNIFWVFRVRNPGLSNAALVEELERMSLESLREYQALCPPKSREYEFAEAELQRRAKGESDPETRK